MKAPPTLRYPGKRGRQFGNFSASHKAGWAFDIPANMFAPPSGNFIGFGRKLNVFATRENRQQLLYAHLAPN
ncbi:hypothetical protein GLA29479_5105 [Lysobacter antibioticus]|nr:hypothetical protein GLA29479_5105 [Lysobacter antibioticus]